MATKIRNVLHTHQWELSRLPGVGHYPLPPLRKRYSDIEVTHSSKTERCRCGWLRHTVVIADGEQRMTEVSIADKARRLVKLTRRYEYAREDY